MPTTETQTAKTFCPLDCPDACSIEAQVRDGRLVKLDGDHRNPVTQGFICSKVRRFVEHGGAPERLRHPAIRDGRKGEGRFRRVSWDEAFERIAAGLGEVLERHGPEAILPYSYGGSNGMLTQGAMDERFFRRLGASRLDQTVCAAATGRAVDGLYGSVPGVAPQDYVHSRLIVIWGANPSVSSIHLVPFVKQAQANGARLVVVDPRRIPLAKTADLHLALRPGTDLPVALALIHHLFETDRADLDFLARHARGTEALRRKAADWSLERAAEVAGVDVADLEAFATLLAETSPAVVRCGWGVERNRNGGSAVAAVVALPAIAGKLGVRGGGFTMSNSSIWRLSVEEAIGAPAAETRRINMNQIGRALLETKDPAIHALFVYNSNFLVTSPDQERIRRGLLRDDLFTVVFDPMLTDTALFADVVLPGTLFYEHADLGKGYGSVVLQRSRPIVEAPGECRDNHTVFLELCDRMGLSREGDARRREDFVDAALERERNPAELAAALEADGLAFHPAGATPRLLEDLPIDKPDGKVDLFPAELDAEAPEGLYTYRELTESAYPLLLISPATHRTISSTLGELEDGKVSLEMHPEDAAARRLRAGIKVRVHNELGEVVCGLRLNDDLQPGVAYLPKGIWNRHTENGAASNALVPDSLTDLGGGACFNDARVEVEAAG